MKIERAWLRIIVSVIVGGIASFALYIGGSLVFWQGGGGQQRLYVVFFIFTAFLAGPTATAVLLHMLTPREVNDGHTRCGKCGYILKGLTEPRCSECGERI